jgi:hypothetical protein
VYEVAIRQAHVEALEAAGRHDDARAVARQTLALSRERAAQLRADERDGYLAIAEHRALERRA